jgi:hypothetical protein
VPDLERMFATYKNGLRQLADDLMSGLDPTPEQRDHLLVLSEILEGVVQSYSAHWLRRTTALDSSTSVMYAESLLPEGRILDVSIRSLVDSTTLVAWQARYLHGVLGLKRSILVTGPAKSGKSTLLNALVQLIPVDQRMVAVEEISELPALKSRSFTVSLNAKPGTPASATALRKAAGMKPTWILAAELQEVESASFFEALAEGVSGLATVDTTDPGESVASWIDSTPEIALMMRKSPPLVIAHMDRDNTGQPRVLHLFEAEVDDSGLTLRERTAS